MSVMGPCGSRSLASNAPPARASSAGAASLFFFLFHLFSLFRLGSGQYEAGGACSFCIDLSVTPGLRYSGRRVSSLPTPVGVNHDCMYQVALHTLGRPHPLPPLPKDVSTIFDVKTSYGSDTQFYDTVAALASSLDPPRLTVLKFAERSPGNHLFFPALSDEQEAEVRDYLNPNVPMLVTMPVHQFFDDASLLHTEFHASYLYSWLASAPSREVDSQEDIKLRGVHVDEVEE
ncbi:hypothetical protein CDD83_7737 [Cordyceps sp. RAO-2017]|nr:hypothetical protein CDD83_7737 [Cordyceps sp. RAO-2017]